MSSDCRWSWRMALVSASLLLLSAAFPPLSVSWAAWLSLAPLAFALTGCNSVSATFGLGFVTGSLWHLVVLDWVRMVSAAAGDANGPLWPSWLALGIVGGLTVGVSAMILRLTVRRLHWPFTLALPIAWIAGESLRDAFSWNLFGTSGEVTSLAITQTDQLIVLQLAELGGVSAITWTVGVVNGFLVDLMLWFTRHQPFHRTSVCVAGICLGTMAAGSLFGVWRATQTVDESIQVCAVPMELTLETVLAARSDAARETVVVWPEHALEEPQEIETGDMATPILVHAARTLNRTLIVGCDRLSRRPLALYNSAVVVTPDGHIAGAGDKRFLAPLERSPLFGRMIDPSGVLARTKYSAASRSGVARLATGHRVGLGVCHDVCFSAWWCDLRSRDDPDFLVCCSSTRFDPSGHGGAFGLALTRLRAVESRRSIVSCAIDGPVTVVDGSGVVTCRTQNGIAVAPVPLDRRTNLSAGIGWRRIAAFVAGLGCLTQACLTYRRRWSCARLDPR